MGRGGELGGFSPGQPRPQTHRGHSSDDRSDGHRWDLGGEMQGRAGREPPQGHVSPPRRAQRRWECAGKTESFPPGGERGRGSAPATSARAEPRSGRPPGAGRGATGARPRQRCREREGVPGPAPTQHPPCLPPCLPPSLSGKAPALPAPHGPAAPNPCCAPAIWGLLFKLQAPPALGMRNRDPEQPELGAGKRGDGPPWDAAVPAPSSGTRPRPGTGPHVTTAVPRAVPGGAGRRAAGTCVGCGVELLPRLFRGWNIPNGAEAARGAAGAGGDPPGTAGRQQPVARGAHGGGTQRGPGRSRTLGPPPQPCPGTPSPGRDHILSPAQ